MRLFLIRHGETPWSKEGKHTGLTDIPLTENGEKQAERLAMRLRGRRFDRVYVSPLARAKATCAIAGYMPQAHIAEALLEWDYGEYEGQTSPAIRETVPDWNIFTHGAPGGESVADVQQRARDFFKEIASCEGDIALFSSGHFLRAFAAVSIGSDATLGRHLLLSTASLSLLESNTKTAAVRLWNDTSHLSNGEL